jgi:hypothetical protein
MKTSPISPEDRALADLYDTTFDTRLAEGQTIPQAHAAACRAIADQALARTVIAGWEGQPIPDSWQEATA